MIRSFLAVSLALALVPTLGAADWPQFKGPNATGVSSEKNLPTKWGKDKRRHNDRLAGQVTASWRTHDLRRTVATRMADLGVLPHVIEAVLNHRSGHKRGVAGIYNRSPYEREVCSALMLWAEHIAAITEGRSSKVVPLKTTA